MSTTCTCARIRRSSRTLTALYDAALAPLGLSTTQFSLLRTLDRTGPTTIGVLAETTAHERSTLSRIVKPLAAQGLVELAASEDRRERPIALSPAGRALLADALPRWQSVQARVDAHLGADGAVLKSLLERIEDLRA